MLLLRIRGAESALFLQESSNFYSLNYDSLRKFFLSIKILHSFEINFKIEQIISKFDCEPL